MSHWKLQNFETTEQHWHCNKLFIFCTENIWGNFLSYYFIRQLFWRFRTILSILNRVLNFYCTKIYAAIFCGINLFKGKFFEDLAKFCQYWPVFSVKFQAPGVELTNHSLEIELTQSRPQRGCFPGYIPKILWKAVSQNYFW